MRLPYTSNPPDFTDNDDKAILERVKARRGEKGLISLDLTLLHAPKIADGWNALLGAVRTRSSLPDNLREIAICRPALINKAWFEWRAHAPLLLATPSFASNPTKLDTVKLLHPSSPGALSPAEFAVLRYADEMTRSISVSDATFKALREEAGLNEQQVVEVTATVASYNMVSRFLVALDVGECNREEPEWYGKEEKEGKK